MSDIPDQYQSILRSYAEERDRDRRDAEMYRVQEAYLVGRANLWQFTIAATLLSVAGGTLFGMYLTWMMGWCR
jgi:hypothetical protein